MNNKQEKIFNRLKSNYPLLSNHVQNDFRPMLRYGDITIKQVLESIPEMERSFDNSIEELKKLKSEIKTIMEYYSRQ